MEAPLDTKTCFQCGVSVSLGGKFCGQCGSPVESAAHDESSEDVFSILTPSLAYYFITLILLATYKLTSLFNEGFGGMLDVTIIDVLVVLLFCLHDYTQLLPLLSFRSITVRPLLLSVLLALVASVVVSIVANVIEVSISDDVFYSTYMFEDTAWPFLLTILFTCVQPALFEEVAFRGFLLTNMQKVATPTAAIYVTGFLFGILHLSIISMLWLVPGGIILAYMRQKHNTLWYGIVAHFTYNLGVILIEMSGII